MAVTKILAKTTRLDHLVRYVTNTKKTEEQVFVSAVGCVPETAARTWMDTKRRFGRSDGVQAYHLIQSFKPGEITPELAHEIGNRFAERYLDGFEVIVGTHVDKAHVTTTSFSIPSRTGTGTSTTPLPPPTSGKSGACRTGSAGSTACRLSTSQTNAL